MTHGSFAPWIAAKWQCQKYSGAFLIDVFFTLCKAWDFTHATYIKLSVTSWHDGHALTISRRTALPESFGRWAFMQGKCVHSLLNICFLVNYSVNLTFDWIDIAFPMCLAFWSLIGSLCSQSLHWPKPQVGELVCVCLPSRKQKLSSEAERLAFEICNQEQRGSTDMQMQGSVERCKEKKRLFWNPATFFAGSLRLLWTEDRKLPMHCLCGIEVFVTIEDLVDQAIFARSAITQNVTDCIGNTWYSNIVLMSTVSLDKTSGCKYRIKKPNLGTGGLLCTLVAFLMPPCASFIPDSRSWFLAEVDWLSNCRFCGATIRSWSIEGSRLGSFLLWKLPWRELTNSLAFSCRWAICEVCVGWQNSEPDLCFLKGRIGGAFERPWPCLCFRICHASSTAG